MTRTTDYCWFPVEVSLLVSERIALVALLASFYFKTASASIYTFSVIVKVRQFQMESFRAFNVRTSTGLPISVVPRTTSIASLSAIENSVAVLLSHFLCKAFSFLVLYASPGNWAGRLCSTLGCLRQELIRQDLSSISIWTSFCIFEACYVYILLSDVYWSGPEDANCSVPFLTFRCRK